MLHCESAWAVYRLSRRSHLPGNQHTQRHATTAGSAPERSRSVGGYLRNVRLTNIHLGARSTRRLCRLRQRKSSWWPGRWWCMRWRLRRCSGARRRSALLAVVGKFVTTRAQVQGKSLRGRPGKEEGFRTPSRYLACRVQFCRPSTISRSSASKCNHKCSELYALDQAVFSHGLRSNRPPHRCWWCTRSSRRRGPGWRLSTLWCRRRRCLRGWGFKH